MPEVTPDANERGDQRAGLRSRGPGQWELLAFPIGLTIGLAPTPDSPTIDSLLGGVVLGVVFAGLVFKFRARRARNAPAPRNVVRVIVSDERRDAGARLAKTLSAAIAAKSAALTALARTLDATVPVDGSDVVSPPVPEADAPAAEPQAPEVARLAVPRMPPPSPAAAAETPERSTAEPSAAASLDDFDPGVAARAGGA